MTSWLVTGGAGYIGAHVVRHLLKKGHHVVVIDDLSTGDGSRVSVPLVIGDIRDSRLVLHTLRKHDVDGVIHLAAAKQVEESVQHPLDYFSRNLVGLVATLEAMFSAGVDRLVYSSSASVYGNVVDTLVSEDSATLPVNPYGETKLTGEWLVHDQSLASGLRYVTLRYFNVAGAGQPALGDVDGRNLIPLTLDAMSRGVAPLIFGSDYATPDGTCVRDFIHVEDLARAHVATLELLDDPGAKHILNVGCGVGHSVREVIETAAEVIGTTVRPEVIARRAGDPARVVADTRRLTTLTDWRPEHDLRSMVSSSWAARQHASLSPDEGRPRVQQAVA